ITESIDLISVTNKWTYVLIAPTIQREAGLNIMDDPVYSNMNFTPSIGASSQAGKIGN
ncbi:unnamed protein product, partial [Allacma fusca]